MAFLGHNIAIEGCIGSGKTTTAKLLAYMLKVNYLEEQSHRHPFLEAFYTDVEKYALETELAFVLIHFHQLVHLETSFRYVSDYTIEKDVLFAQMNLKGTDLALFDTLYQHLKPRLRAPKLTIILDAPIDVLLRRIRQRGRSYETNMPPQYLGKLKNKYLACQATLWPNARILTVSAEESPDDVARRAYDLAGDSSTIVET